MNQKCNTRFLSDGHYDELYGRTRDLDLIAHNFMNIVMLEISLYPRKMKNIERN